MGFISREIQASKEERRHFRKAPSFVPAGQSTQLIIGATPDSDAAILRLSESLYGQFGLKRVYYSAYMPVNQGPSLPDLPAPPLIRENRLYQADWLLRFYGFQARELLGEGEGNLDLNLDPKADWALRNLDQFPVEVNSAPRETLLRVPGIGVRSVMRILTARRVGRLDYEDLKKMGVVLKRARHFITCKGRYYGTGPFREEAIRYRLSPSRDLLAAESQGIQLSLFPEEPAPYLQSDPRAALLGEL